MCGIISFTGHLAPRLDNPLDIRLHGQLVSRVESYKYLGVLIDSKLDHSAWLKQKRSALEHTISALHPVLANHQLTVNYRSRIFSAVVMSKAYYGLELVGGNKSHLAPLQTTINKGIRLFTGARLSTAIGPLLVETGGWVSSHSPIGITDNDVFTLNVQEAVGKIPALVLVSSDQTAIQKQILADTTSQTKDSQATALVCSDGDSANRWRLCIAPKVCRSTILGHFWILQGSQFRSITSPWHKISDACAHGCTLDSKKAIQIGILIDTHPFSVDRCILCNQQLLSTSIAHLVVECEQVTGHRIQSGLVPAIQKSRLRLLGCALNPGVENVYTWLRGGVLNGEADLN
ncbi:hypothetical protein BASA83_009878 [Batrachochytrium salamandrivorans]|nr:hypothetical protein BASA83_009878 [Batrachochytrium salamandrivorans]